MKTNKQNKKITFNLGQKRSFNTKYLAIDNHFNKKAKSYFYGKKGKPIDAYYTIKTGYSKRYTKKLQNQGLEANDYNYFSVVSDIGKMTPAKVRDEILQLMKDYESDPSDILENFSTGSGQNSQDSRIVSITVNFIY